MTPDVVSRHTREVLEYVSAGRGYVDVRPYPDSAARIALGLLPEEGSAVTADLPSVRASWFTVCQGDDGYPWLVCTACDPDGEGGESLVCLDDAHPLPDLVLEMARHAAEVHPEDPPVRRSVYVRASDAPVVRSECLGALVTVDYGEHDTVVGVEMVGAVGVDLDGRPV